MNINIKATNISLTPAISDYVEKKIGMLEKFFESKDVLINVEVGKTTKHHKSGDIFRAEIRLSLNGEEYYTVAETPDLYAAIDEVKDKLSHDLSRGKKKAFKLFRKGSSAIKRLLKGFRK